MRIFGAGSSVHLETLSAGDARAISDNINDPEIIAGINNPSVHHPYTIEDAMRFIGFSLMR